MFGLPDFLFYNRDEIIDGDELLLAGFHVLEGEFAFGDLVLASEGDEGDLLGVGIRHLLLHLR